MTAVNSPQQYVHYCSRRDTAQSKLCKTHRTFITALWNVFSWLQRELHSLISEVRNSRNRPSTVWLTDLGLHPWFSKTVVKTSVDCRNVIRSMYCAQFRINQDLCVTSLSCRQMTQLYERVEILCTRQSTLEIFSSVLTCLATPLQFAQKFLVSWGDMELLRVTIESLHNALMYASSFFYHYRIVNQKSRMSIYGVSKLFVLPHTLYIPNLQPAFYIFRN